MAGYETDYEFLDRYEKPLRAIWGDKDPATVITFEITLADLWRLLELARDAPGYEMELQHRNETEDW